MFLPTPLLTEHTGQLIQLYQLAQNLTRYQPKINISMSYKSWPLPEQPSCSLPTVALGSAGFAWVAAVAVVRAAEAAYLR